MLSLETNIFTKQIKDFISDEEYRQLQQYLLVQPGKDDLIKNGGGIRVLYYWVTEDDQIVFVASIKTTKFTCDG